MALKVLGQLACAAATLETVYTVPAAKSAVISTLAFCNRSSSAVTYRVAVRPAGAAISNLHYIAFDVVLPANSTDYLSLGISLATTDVLSVFCSAASASVTAFGDEA